MRGCLVLIFRTTSVLSLLSLSESLGLSWGGSPPGRRAGRGLQAHLGI